MLPPFMSQPLIRAFNTLLDREPWAQERLRVHAGKLVRLVVGAVELSLRIDANGKVEEERSQSQQQSLVEKDAGTGTLVSDNMHPGYGSEVEARTGSTPGGSGGKTPSHEATMHQTGQATASGVPPATHRTTPGQTAAYQPAASQPGTPQPGTPNVTVRIAASDLPRLVRADEQERMHYVQIEGEAALAHVVADLARHLRWDFEDDLAAVVGDIPARRLMSAGQELFAGVRTSASRFAENLAEYITHEANLLLDRPSLTEFARDVRQLEEDLNRLEARANNWLRSKGAA